MVLVWFDDVFFHIFFLPPFPKEAFSGAAMLNFGGVTVVSVFWGCAALDVLGKLPPNFVPGSGWIGVSF